MCARVELRNQRLAFRDNSPLGGLTSIEFAAIAPAAINTVEKTTVTGFIVIERLILLGGDCRYLLAALELRLGEHLRTGGGMYEREDGKGIKQRAEVRMSVGFIFCFCADNDYSPFALYVNEWVKNRLELK